MPVTAQALLRPLHGNPQQPLHGVDLVAEREVGMAVAPLPQSEHFRSNRIS